MLVNSYSMQWIRIRIRKNSDLFAGCRDLGLKFTGIKNNNKK
jgi:hypothetical protein